MYVSLWMYIYTHIIYIYTSIDNITICSVSDKIIHDLIVWRISPLFDSNQKMSLEFSPQTCGAWNSHFQCLPVWPYVFLSPKNPGRIPGEKSRPNERWFAMLLCVPCFLERFLALHLACQAGKVSPRNDVGNKTKGLKTMSVFVRQDNRNEIW